jgi:hypothetical protein
MTYALVEAGNVIEYPLYAGDIKLRHPNTSFPTPFSPPDGYELVADTPVPELDYTKNVTEGTPVFVGGVLTRVWVVSDATEEEVTARTEAEANKARMQRDGMLAACDWTQLPDASEAAVDVPAWAAYRQQLRDVSEQAGFPWNIQWPDEPVAT